MKKVTAIEQVLVGAALFASSTVGIMGCLVIFVMFAISKEMRKVFQNVLVFLISIFSLMNCIDNIFQAVEIFTIVVYRRIQKGSQYIPDFFNQVCVFFDF